MTMTVRPRSPRRRRARIRLLAALIALAAFAAVGVGAVLALRPQPPPVNSDGAGGPSASTGASPVAVAAAVPVDIEIPAIKVRSRLVPLAVDGSGELQAPTDPGVAGWFAAGVVPGETGPSVIGGHVDSETGPGIFHALGELTAGDRVTVRRSDDRTVTFQVTRVTQVSKSAFPTQLVYGPTPGPELRLVTCGGHFDRDRSSYVDNVVIEAVLI